MTPGFDVRIGINTGLVVVGAGYIGLEFACVFQALGGRQGDAVGEDRQVPEQPLLVLGQQLVGPLDGGPETVGQRHGGDRGERGRPLDIRSCLVEKTERGQACLVEPMLEHRGREPVDDREDQALASDGRQSLASTLSPAKRELARRPSRTPAIGAPTASA